MQDQKRRPPCPGRWWRSGFILLSAFSCATLLAAGLPGGVAAETKPGSSQPTCEADGSSVQLVAPSPRALEPVIAADPDIQRKLAERRTINVAGPWLNLDRHELSDYSLVWHGWNEGPGGDALWLREIYWVHYRKDRLDTSFRFHGPDLQRFLTEERWDAQSEYGALYRLAFEDPDFPQMMAATVERVLSETGAKGVVLDWWIDKQPTVPEAVVRAVRGKIAMATRQRIGPGPLIIGNVGWTRDASTHADLNGVFMERWKKPSERGYSCAELLRMEDLLKFHDQYLAQPKIIVFEPWRVTRGSSSSDRKSKLNRAMARLFTAMAAVVPRNGYILYSDNARDRSEDDHGHYYYDIYRIDLGRPVSGGTRVAPGVGYRLFADGVIAYNATPARVDMEIKGKSIRLKPLSGVFCKSSGGEWDCSL